MRTATDPEVTPERLARRYLYENANRIAQSRQLNISTVLRLLMIEEHRVLSGYLDHSRIGMSACLYISPDMTIAPQTHSIEDVDGYYSLIVAIDDAQTSITAALQGLDYQPTNYLGAITFKRVATLIAIAFAIFAYILYTKARYGF